jgi:hypothetical protein
LSAIIERLLADCPAQVRTTQLARALGVMPATVRKWVDLRRLPTPLRLSSRVFVFDRDEVIEHVRRLQPEEAGHAAAH